jgi:tetratricopeptide (TPR) repeat protein
MGVKLQRFKPGGLGGDEDKMELSPLLLETGGRAGRMAAMRFRIVFIMVSLALAGLFPASSALFGIGRETGSQPGQNTGTAMNYDSIIGFCTEAIQRDPNNAKNYFNRGTIYMLKDEADPAIADFSDAIRLDPQNAKYYYYRGSAHGTKGEKANNPAEYDLAIADFSQAITYDARDAQAYYGRGATYAERYEYEKAIADYGQAIQLDPGNEEAYNNYAWVLATCPKPGLRDGKKAVEYATRACELSQWKECASLDTLAAAYAEAGDFDNAVKWENQCLQAPNLTDAIATDAKTRLALYQSHKPYHESK